MKLNMVFFKGVPASGSVQEVLPVSYTVFNHTDLVQEVEVEIEPSESFLFAGNSQVNLFLLLLVLSGFITQNEPSLRPVTCS